MKFLLHLLLSPDGSHVETGELSQVDMQEIHTLANTNHVIMRGFEVLRRAAVAANDHQRAEWAVDALAAERGRIENAVSFLRAICAAFEEQGYDVLVIKSLDHWPDLGSDLDLFTGVASQEICAFMRSQFKAEIAPRSWGDRLAGKWNFYVPGLPEAVEIHMGRLGQTGEQVKIASWLVERARTVAVGDNRFRVPAASDRLMISTLQRMYRHFYFRLCDIVDSAALVTSGDLDFDDLRSAAQAAGIWEGVATYLVIVSDYLKRYQGSGLNLPQYVIAAARFGGDAVYFARGFLRVPILPQSAGLYGSQLTGLLRRRELHNSARLGLLPWLATAAAVGQKITGSDKGIW
jgi:hypothetical protein